MKSINRQVGWSLVAAGAGLIIAGGSLVYPHIHSRVAAPGPAAAGGAPQRPAVSSHQAEQPRESSHDRVAGPAPAQTPRGTTASGSILVASEIASPAAKLSESPDSDSPGAPPTRIVIPAIRVDAPVIPVSWDETEVAGETQAAWDVPDEYAAGWHKTSALLGEAGNTVLNGHNTSYGEVFRSLYTLEVGDHVLLYSQEISRTYEVSQTMILPEAGQPLEVRLKNAQYLLPTSDDRLTIVTCHPYASLRNRLIVIARPSERETVGKPPEEP